MLGQYYTLNDLRISQIYTTRGIIVPCYPNLDYVLVCNQMRGQDFESNTHLQVVMNTQSSKAILFSHIVTFILQTACYCFLETPEKSLHGGKYQHDIETVTLLCGVVENTFLISI